jgi:hypothetical protein
VSYSCELVEERFYGISHCSLLTSPLISSSKQTRHDTSLTSHIAQRDHVCRMEIEATLDVRHGIRRNCCCRMCAISCNDLSLSFDSETSHNAINETRNHPCHRLLPCVCCLCVRMLLLLKVMSSECVFCLRQEVVTTI